MVTLFSQNFEFVVSEKQNKFTNWLSNYLTQPRELDKFTQNAIVNNFDKLRELEDGCVFRADLQAWLRARDGEVINVNYYKSDEN